MYFSVVIAGDATNEGIICLAEPLEKQTHKNLYAHMCIVAHQPHHHQRKGIEKIRVNQPMQKSDGCKNHLSFLF